MRKKTGLIQLVLILPFGIFLVAARAQEPITLEQAVRLALDRNPALRAVEEDASAVHARIGQTRAAWFPRIDFSQGFTRGNNPVYVFGTLLTQRRFTADSFSLFRLNTPTPLDNFQTRLDGQMLLFDSGRRLLHMRSARRTASAADYQTEQARQDLILRVMRAYYAVIVGRENVDAAREALHTAESNEARVVSLEKAGLVVASDRLSAQVFRAQMKERVVLAENGLQVARMVFARELGLDLQATREPLETLVEPQAAEKTIEQWEQDALTGRPALRAAELERDAAANQQKLAKAEFGPKIGLFADFERDALTLGGPSGTNWAVGVRLEFNILGGGADRYRLAEAQARDRQAGHQLDWFRSGVRIEVRQAYLEAQAAAERAAAAHDSVEQARESLRIIQNRYETGLATLTDLLRVQTAQLEVRTAYLGALHDWQVARAQLEHAAGLLTLDSALIHRARTGASEGAKAP